MTLNTKHLVLLPTNCRIFDQVRCLIGHKIGFIIQGSNGKFTNIDHWSLERTRYFAHLAPWVLPSASWHPGAIREGQDRGALPWSQETGHFECGDNIEFRTQFCDPCAFMVQWFKLILIWSSWLLQESRVVLRNSFRTFLSCYCIDANRTGWKSTCKNQPIIAEQTDWLLILLAINKGIIGIMFFFEGFAVSTLGTLACPIYQDHGNPLIPWACWSCWSVANRRPCPLTSIDNIW